MNKDKKVPMHCVHGICEAVLLSIAATTTETDSERERKRETWLCNKQGACVPSSQDAVHASVWTS